MKAISFAKEIYFLLFNFIRGKTERKFYKMAAHSFTILLFAFVVIYLHQSILYFTSGDINFNGIVNVMVIAPLGMVVFVCFMKFAIFLHGR
jgi:hypothetical protein